VPSTAGPAVPDEEDRRFAEMAAAAANLPAVPGRDEFLTLCQLAQMYSRSGVVPKQLRGKPHDVLVVLMTARDLGIPLTAGLRKVYVIDGNPSIAPQLKISLVRKKGLGNVIQHPANAELTDRQGAIALGPGGQVFTDSEGNVTGWTGAIAAPFWFTWDDAITGGYVRQGCTPTSHTAECRAARTKQGVPQTNGQGEANYCKDNWKKHPKRMLFQRACLPMRAEALTPDGWRSPEKLTVGDRVLGFNAETGRTEWTRIAAINVFDARETFTVEHRSFRAVATAGHEWVCDSWRAPGRYEKRRTDHLDGHPYRRLLVAAPLADERPNGIEPDEAARIGWVLTDGNIRWRGNSPTVTISQAKHVEEVRRLFGDRSTETTLTPGGWGHLLEHRWRMNAADSRALLARFGVATKDDAAAVPAMLDAEARQAMFHAMTLANGEQFCTGHKAVMDCWVILATMLGLRVGRARFQNGSWRTRINESPVVSIKRLSVTPAVVEPVWCPTTDLGTWVARIDEQVTITGNSGFMVDDNFSEATLGLYDPDELGAVLDDDGRLIDVSTVEVPEGFGSAGQAGAGGSGGGGDDLAPVSPEDAWEVQRRYHALPEDAQGEFRDRWLKAKLVGSPIRPPFFPAAKLGLVQATLRGVEQQWKAQGKYDPETGPAALDENVLAPAVAAAVGLLASFGCWRPGRPATGAPEAAQAAGDAAEGEPDTAGPSDAVGAEPGQPAGTEDGRLLDPGAAVELPPLPDGAPDGAADPEAAFQWVVSTVKTMTLSEARRACRARSLPDDGKPDECRERLARSLLAQMGVPPETL
jgi:hypothetical protein